MTHEWYPNSCLSFVAQNDIVKKIGCLTHILPNVDSRSDADVFKNSCSEKR